MSTLTSAAHAQNLHENHWETYESRTLQSIVEMHRDDIKALESDPKAMVLTGDNFQSRMQLVYEAKLRPLLSPKRFLLQSWRRMLKDQAPPEGLFATEALFREGRRDFWIAVQKPVLDDLRKELPKGGTLQAYVIWIGAIKAGKHWEWLFTMNGFRSCGSPQTPCQP